MDKSLLTGVVLLGCGVIAVGCSNPNVSPQRITAPSVNPAPIEPVDESRLVAIGEDPIRPLQQEEDFNGLSPSEPQIAGAEARDLQAIPTPDTSAAGISRVQTVSVSPSIDFGRDAVLGAWNVTTTTDNCALTLSLTTWTGGFRASTRQCVSEKLKSVGAWNVRNQQLTLFNRTGDLIAQLQTTGNNRFDGKTNGDNVPISVFR